MYRYSANSSLLDQMSYLVSLGWLYLIATSILQINGIEIQHHDESVGLLTSKEMNSVCLLVVRPENSAHSHPRTLEGTATDSNELTRVWLVFEQHWWTLIVIVTCCLLSLLRDRWTSPGIAFSIYLQHAGGVKPKGCAVNPPLPHLGRWVYDLCSRYNWNWHRKGSVIVISKS